MVARTRLLLVTLASAALALAALACAGRGKVAPPPAEPEVAAAPAPPPPVSAPDPAVREARRLEEEVERVDVDALERGHGAPGPRPTAVELRFDGEGTTLGAASRAALDELASRLGEESGGIEIATAPAGTSGAALAAARARGEAVRAYLRERWNLAERRIVLLDGPPAGGAGDPQPGTTTVRLIAD
jgi:hypothetical protein